MEAILGIATILGGISAVWFFWDKIASFWGGGNSISPKDETTHNTEIHNALLILANEIKDCIESSESMVVASGHGSPNCKINLPSIALNNYGRLKNFLLKGNVFSDKEWLILEKAQDEIKTVNDFNKNKDKLLAGSRIYHSVNTFYSGWVIVSEKYKKYGGKEIKLVEPMRIPNIEKHIPKPQNA